MKLILLLCIPTLAMAGNLWRAHLPGGGVATAVETSWGAIVNYEDPAAERVSITARSAYRYTSRTADAPLTLSWSNAENVNWASLANDHAVSFWAFYPGGLTESAEFYNTAGVPTVALAKFSGDSGARAVPEPAAGGIILGIVLAAYAGRRAL